MKPLIYYFFFFNDTATTEIYTLSLHDALPIWSGCGNELPQLVLLGHVRHLVGQDTRDFFGALRRAKQSRGHQNPPAGHRKSIGISLLNDLKVELVFLFLQSPRQTVNQGAQFGSVPRILHRFDVFLDLPQYRVAQLCFPRNRHLPHQKIERPAAQHPDRGGHDRESDQKDPGQPERPPALPLPAEIASQKSQPVAAREEIILQNPVVGRVNDPVGFFRTGKRQAVRAVPFDVQSIQRQLDIGCFGGEEQSLRINGNPAVHLAFAKGRMNCGARIDWTLILQGVASFYQKRVRMSKTRRAHLDTPTEGRASVPAPRPHPPPESPGQGPGPPPPWL